MGAIARGGSVILTGGSRWLGFQAQLWMFGVSDQPAGREVEKASLRILENVGGCSELW